MKKKNLLSFLLCLSFCVALQAQQITTDGSQSVQDLIQNNLAQGCVEISNISSTINGSANGLQSFGYFEKASSNFPFENGIVLTTGNVDDAGNSLNTSPLNEGELSWGTDTDLENALGITDTYNATSIQFEFVSVANTIQFNYILASEEYRQEYPCFYSDGFAFLIREAGSNDPFDNIALIPGTNIPVNTNTIHGDISGFCDAENPEYFEGNNIGDTNYNGRTVVMTATASIQPNVAYEIKLIIADQTDQNADSAVFIEGNSFDAVVDLGPDIVTCGTSVDLDGDIQNNLASYEWFLNDVLINGENNSTYTATQSGTYKVEVTIQISNSECVIEDEIEITLNSEQSASTISDYMLCDDDSNDGQESFDLTIKNNEVLNSVSPGDYIITYHYSDAEAQAGSNPILGPVVNSTSPQQIFVRIEDPVNGCLAYTTFNLIVNEIPEANEPAPFIACDTDDEADGFTNFFLYEANDGITGGDPNLFVSYHFTQNEADLGINPIFSPFQNLSNPQQVFVRVYDATTGCFNTTTMTLEVIDTPVVNEQNQWINACEQDMDGFETFDLTEVIDNVLQGLTGVTVTFHETEADALTGDNPIADPENYQNIVPQFQLVYIRIEDDETGCAVVVDLELHANIIQTGFDFQIFRECDDLSGDGVEDFNLIEVGNTLVNGYDDFELTFYETQDDQENDQNPINVNLPYSVSGTQTLFTTIVSGDCVEFVEVVLEVSPAVDVIERDLDYCDDNNDGFVYIDLFSFNDTVADGVPAYNVKYYLNQVDAENNENILPQFYLNSANPQTFWIRVTNSQTGCYDIEPINVTVVDAPSITQPSAIIVCDDDQDGLSVIDLTSKESEIVTSPASLDITYHNTYNDAFVDENPITAPDAYNIGTQTVYIRVENESTACFSIAYLYVYVNTLPVFEPISNFENCEADIANVADFYFYLKDDEILNGQTGKQVLYFETENDAINRTNEIYKYGAYQNTSSPQTIYVRVENITDQLCFGTSSFVLEVGSLPVHNEPTDIFICDDISNDGVVTIDLSDKIVEIEAGAPVPLDISFHPSYFDADNDFNELPLNYSNTFNPENIFARIENGTYCHAVTSFELNIISVPTVYPANPMEQCDDNYDGIVTFNLTDIEIEILDVRQDFIEVTYHLSEEDLDNNENAILDPENYTNESNPQIVYIRVTNTISDCYVNVPLELIVNLPPVINDFQIYEICDNPTSYFDLNTINSVVVDDTTGIDITYHSSQDDANSGNNPMSTDYTYSSVNDTIFIRITFADTGCHTTYSFNLLVNPLPIANMPGTLLACDDASNDTFEIFDLSTQNATVLGGQSDDDFTVTFYDSEAAANLGTNPIDVDYNAQNEQIIYVRVENNLTGCYSLTQFDVVVFPHPDPAQPIALCDADYDGIRNYDLTTSESDLYNPMPTNIIITYFENETDLEADENVIPDPSDYTSLSNPQTVYIKVFNTSANCYAVVPLELNPNLPPPINEFGIFEICDNPANSFNLFDIESTLVDDSTNVQFTYFDNAVDAEANQNAISEAYTYQTIADVIYVRVEDTITGCFYVYSFTLQVNPLPIAYQPNNLEACDDESNNGFEQFNLFSQTDSVLGDQDPDLFTVTYYLSEAFSDAGENALGELYTGQDEQTIYVRIENNDTGCYSLTQFDLVVNPFPELPSMLIDCDINYDAQVPFDLTVAEAEMFQVADPDHVFTYFTSVENLENDIEPISNPEAFINTSNPQVVYVKAYHTVADCYNYMPLELRVNLPPAINAFDVFDACENPDNAVNLSEVSNALLDSDFNVLLSYYSSQTDAENQENALDLNYNYQSNNDTIFVRVEFSTTHCYYIHSFELRVNVNPIAHQPGNMSECDDDYDGLLLFDLTEQNAQILSGQSSTNHSITYYQTLEDSESGVNVLATIHEAYDNETIYVRIEDNATGCFALTEFEIFVRPLPVLNIPDQVICLNELPLIVNVETGNENDSYLWSTGSMFPEIEITEVGFYSVTVTTAYNCFTTATFEVSESESAMIEFTETLDFSDPNNITVTVNGIGNYLYQLDDGDPQESNVFENVLMGYHTITVYDQNGCAEVTKDVVVVDAPNFFTPNGDLQNPTWHIIGIETLPSSIVHVFDRYGKLMTSLTSTSQGWDGRYNGNNMPAADYWWIAYIRRGDIAFEVSGHFALVR